MKRLLDYEDEDKMCAYYILIKCVVIIVTIQNDKTHDNIISALGGWSVNRDAISIFSSGIYYGSMKRENNYAYKCAKN